jgi:hypothetical protein
MNLSLEAFVLDDYDVKHNHLFRKCEVVEFVEPAFRIAFSVKRERMILPNLKKLTDPMKVVRLLHEPTLLRNRRVYKDHPERNPQERFLLSGRPQPFRGTRDTS